MHLDQRHAPHSLVYLPLRDLRVCATLHEGLHVFVAILDAKAAVFVRHGRPGECAIVFIHCVIFVVVLLI